MHDLLRPSVLRAINVGMCATAVLVLALVLAMQQGEGIDGALPILLFLLAVPIGWLIQFESVWSVRFAGPSHAATQFGIGDVTSNVVGLLYQLLLGTAVLGQGSDGSSSSEPSLFWWLNGGLIVAGLVIITVAGYADAYLPPFASAAQARCPTPALPS